MSDIFKLKVCIGNANIELEGEGNLVHTIFCELRESGLGQLSGSVLVQSKPDEVTNTNTPCAEEIDVESKKTQNTELIELPQINTIVIKNLPKTEAEWVVVYALYTSEQGTKLFSKEDLRQMYQDSGRWDDNRSKNFSQNLKKAVAEDWFSIVNESMYSLLETGKKMAYEIIQRPVGNNGSKKQKKSASSTKTTYTPVDLGLNEVQRQELRQYLLSFTSVNNMERAVLIAYKLLEYGIAEFNEESIFTALRIADLSTSYDIKSSLTNGKSKKNYFILGDTTGMYKLHHIGEDHARELEKARGTE